MFGIGTQEILIILALAIIVVGPRKLPEMAASFGRAFSQFRRAMDDLKESAATDLKTNVQQEKAAADGDFLKKYPDLVEEARRRQAEAEAATASPPAGTAPAEHPADAPPAQAPPAAAPAAADAPELPAEAPQTGASEEEVPVYPPESVEH